MGTSYVRPAIKSESKDATGEPSKAARWSFFTLLCWFLSGFGAFTLLPWGTDGEPYSPIDAAYFQAQILTTVGYGDLPPHNAARVFTTIYVLLTVALVAGLLSELLSELLQREKANTTAAIERSHTSAPVETRHKNRPAHNA